MNLQTLGFGLTAPELKLASARKDETPFIESPSNSLRRRMVIPVRKTNEEMIQQSHQQLMKFVDRLDEEVQRVVGKYEAQFLLAYRKHVKKVKEQIEQMKKRSMNNINSEKAYQQKVESLEKQLIVFRQGSLKISQKIIKKDQQIESLKLRIKELENENKYLVQNLSSMTRRNKMLSASVEKEKLNSAGFNQSLAKTQVKESKSLPKHSDEKLLLFSNHDADIERRGATAVLVSKAHSFHLGNPFRGSFRAINNNQNKNSTVAHDSSNSKQQAFQKQEIAAYDNRDKISPNDYRKRLKLRSRGQSIKVGNELWATEMQKLRSKEFAQKSDNEKYFMRCIEQVKKELMRRQAVSSLNYFKQNGPISLLQFKKTDYLSLMQMLFRNEDIVARLYELIFKAHN